MVEIAAKSFMLTVVVALDGKGTRACEIDSCFFQSFERALKAFLFLRLGVWRETNNEVFLLRFTRVMSKRPVWRSLEVPGYWLMEAILYIGALPSNPAIKSSQWVRSGLGLRNSTVPIRCANAVRSG